MTQPDSLFQLSIRVSATADSISGCQLFLSFDPAVAELTDATAGTLYAESGHPTDFHADELGPGLWRFYDTTFGPGTFVLPPGELFHITFRGVDYGQTMAHIDTVYMSDAAQPPNPILGITFEHGYIFVVDPAGVDEDTGLLPSLGPAYPNPFATSATIRFRVPEPNAWGCAMVYSSSGRLVRRLALPDGKRFGEIVWDGRADDGSEVVSSVYFVRLSGERGTRLRLVKIR
jgi:hypothetical protein